MIKKCVICGTKFEASGNRIVCSAECKKINDKQKRAIWRHSQCKQPMIIKCPNCEEMFEATGKRKFCCNECKEIYYSHKNMSMREWKRKMELRHHSYDQKHLTDVAMMASKLGVTYGQYVGYRDTGYLGHYKKMRGLE